jgi:hypothetical protein
VGTSFIFLLENKMDYEDKESDFDLNYENIESNPHLKYMTPLQLKKKGYKKAASRIKEANARNLKALQREAEMKTKKDYNDFIENLFFLKARKPDMQLNDDLIKTVGDIFQYDRKTGKKEAHTVIESKKRETGQIHIGEAEKEFEREKGDYKEYLKNKVENLSEENQQNAIVLYRALQRRFENESNIVHNTINEDDMIFFSGLMNRIKQNIDNEVVLEKLQKNEEVRVEPQETVGFSKDVEQPQEEQTREEQTQEENE